LDGRHVDDETEYRVVLFQHLTGQKLDRLLIKNATIMSIMMDCQLIQDSSKDSKPFADLVKNQSLKLCYDVVLL